MGEEYMKEREEYLKKEIERGAERRYYECLANRASAEIRKREALKRDKGRRKLLVWSKRQISTGIPSPLSSLFSPFFISHTLSFISYYSRVGRVQSHLCGGKKGSYYAYVYFYYSSFKFINMYFYLVALSWVTIILVPSFTVPSTSKIVSIIAGIITIFINLIIIILITIINQKYGTIQTQNVKIN